MKVELLAPAGSFESMQAAYAAGADAVYIGGSRFGARAYADNPDTERLQEAIDYAHLRNKKLYLTVNTLLKDREMDELYAYLEPLYRHGLDAVIVQDPGVFLRIRECFPDLDIHASTQMTITGVDGAKLLKEMGASRVVTARELSLKELKAIHDQVGIEIESFVHGALCYCYSGQCLLSSMIGGRSGNRGRCAQPCRLPYEWSEKNKQPDASYLLSPKDICTVELIPQLIENGVYSFKIEGRMKRPEYTAGVTRIYRKYIDRYLKNPKAPYKVEQEDRLELMDLYNRGGFSEGYYYTQNGPKMMSMYRPNHQGTPVGVIQGIKNGRIQIKTKESLHAGDVLEVSSKKEVQELTIKESAGANRQISAACPTKMKQATVGTIVYRTKNDHLLKSLKNQYLDTEFPQKINGKLILSKGKPAILTLICANFEVTEEGACADQALNRPITKQDIEKQLRKTGGSGFQFEKLEIQMEENLFLPVQVINDLRRRALERLKTIIQSSFYRTDGVDTKRQKNTNESIKSEPPFLTVSLENLAGLECVCKQPEVERIYIDCCAFLSRDKFLQHSKEVVMFCRNHKKECYYILPWIFRKQARDYYKNAEEILFAYNGVIVRNLDELSFLETIQYPGKKIGDWNFYSWNQEAVLFAKEHGISECTAPVELNRKELMARGMDETEMIVYGFQPLMVSAQCQMKNLKNCTHTPSLTWLTDRKKKKFAVKNNCSFCYNTIYNSMVLDLSDCREEILQMHPHSLRLQFTIETPEEIERTVQMFGSVFRKNIEPKRICSEYTRGHFARGVE